MAFAFTGAVEKFVACALGAVGLLLSTDPLHEKASPEFKKNFGYAAWYRPPGAPTTDTPSLEAIRTRDSIRILYGPYTAPIRPVYGPYTAALRRCAV